MLGRGSEGAAGHVAPDAREGAIWEVSTSDVNSCGRGLILIGRCRSDCVTRNDDNDFEAHWNH